MKNTPFEIKQISKKKKNIHKYLLTQVDIPTRFHYYYKKKT